MDLRGEAEFVAPGPETWPRKRTYAMFLAWFDVRIVDLVFDLADAPLSQEEL